MTIAVTMVTVAVTMVTIDVTMVTITVPMVAIATGTEGENLGQKSGHAVITQILNSPLLPPRYLGLRERSSNMRRRLLT